MPRFRRLLFLAAAILLGPAGRSDAAPPPPVPVSFSSAPAAFAIVAVDSVRREWGIAAVSRWIAVGARSLDGRAEVGAWCALDLPDPREAARGLDLLGRGVPATAVVESVLTGDPRREERQFSLVDRSGAVAAFTGTRCPRWSGERVGKGYVCQGMGLRDVTPLVAMGGAFQSGGGSLAERLLAAVEAAEAVFPVREEVESAAILVVREGGGLNGWSDRLVDLRVDLDQDAVQELKKIYAAHAATFLPAAFARFGDDAKRRGDTISAEREYARAESGFRAAIALRPKDPDARNELAWFLATHDRELPDAVGEARTAVSLRPRDPILYDTLAEAEYRSGSLNRAIDAMERAVKYSGGEARYADRLSRWIRERAALEGKAVKP